MSCEICEMNELESDDEIAMQACSECARAYGLMPMPPPRRPPRPCATCSGLKFIRTIPREHSIELGKDRARQVSTPMLLTHLPKFQGGVAVPLDLRRGVGRLEVYACVSCGRVEWFCADVESIPVHPHLLTDLVDYTSQSPYR